MQNLFTNKSLLNKIIILLILLFFLDRCSLINITTSDLFRPSYYKDFKCLTENISSENYELVLVKNGTFPILFDSIKNEYYVKTENGLAKFDSNGKVVISANLADEFSSTTDFENFIPYVFVDKGVYDFTGDKLGFKAFSKIINNKNDMSDEEYFDVFLKNYNEAEIVVYEKEFYLENERMCTPMYFRVGNNWILMYSQTNDNRFSHPGNYGFPDITIGQVDYNGYPAKYNNTGLIVLKDHKNAIYSTIQIAEKITDEYFNKYFGTSLKEKNLNYNTSNEVSLVSRKKERFLDGKYYFNIPNWIAPDFINEGYYQIKFNNENLYFKEKAWKKFGQLKCETETYLYESPLLSRSKAKVAFLHYGLDLGGSYDNNTGITTSDIKNNGLYIIRPKNKKTSANN